MKELLIVGLATYVIGFIGYFFVFFILNFFILRIVPFRNLWALLGICLTYDLLFSMYRHTFSWPLFALNAVAYYFGLRQNEKFPGLIRSSAEASKISAAVLTAGMLLVSGVMLYKAQEKDNLYKAHQEQKQRGILEFKGQGSGKNHVEALKNLAPAAKDNDPEAQFYSGMILVSGQGVEKDHAAAAAFFLDATVRGHVLAAANLAYMRQEGLGIPKDLQEAYTLYSVAAAGGNKPSEANRDKLRRVLTAEQIAAGDKDTQKVLDGIKKIKGK